MELTDQYQFSKKKSTSIQWKKLAPSFEGMEYKANLMQYLMLFNNYSPKAKWT